MFTSFPSITLMPASAIVFCSPLLHLLQFASRVVYYFVTGKTMATATGTYSNICSFAMIFAIQLMRNEPNEFHI